MVKLPGRVPTLKLLTAALLAAAVPAGNLPASGYNLAGVGARALGLGGAFHALSDDWSAMYWNPAGLAGQADAVNLDVKMLYPGVWFTPNISGELPGFETYRSGIEQTSVMRGHAAPAFGLIRALSADYTAGISLFTPSALGAQWDGLFLGPPRGYNNDVPFPTRAWSSSLRVMDFHPTIAYRASPRFRVGWGLSVQYAELKLESPSLVPSGAPMPYQNFFVDGTLDGSGWGTGFNLGLLYDINDRLHFGFSLRGQVNIAVEGKITQVLYLPVNPVLAGSDSALFSGGTLTVEPKATADFPIPLDVGLGLAYDFYPPLTLAADLLWTRWSEVDVIHVDVSGALGPTGAPSEDIDMLMKYKDCFRFSFGCDYRLAPDRLDLRAGYYYEQSPIPDGTLRPSITDVADKHNLALGFGWKPLRHLSVEGYYERVMSLERRTAAGDVNLDGTLDNLPGQWRMQADTFGLALGFRF